MSSTGSSFNFLSLPRLNETQFSNGTDAAEELLPAHVRVQLKKAQDIIIVVLLVLIMTAMGCLLSLNEIKKTLKRPVGLAIGMLCQFVLLPLSAFGLVHALQLRDLIAQGLLILATCPGGALSNIFTHWVDGDITLSVSMTTASTVMAFGMMPLNLWIYSRGSSSSSIPYVNIVIMLASVIGPVCLGVLIKWKFPKMARYVVKAGSISGISAIVIVEITVILLSYGVFRSGWKVWFSAALFPFLGFSLGYLCAFIFRRTHSVCRTIAFETCTQSVPLCFALISLSYPLELLQKVSPIPVFFSFFYILETSAFTAAYILTKKLCHAKFKSPPDAEEDVQVPLKDIN